MLAFRSCVGVLRFCEICNHGVNTLGARGRVGVRAD